MRFTTLFILLLSLCIAKYSYSDSCYRYQYYDTTNMKAYYQFYVNKEGVPHSQDSIIHYYTPGTTHYLSVQYYYHAVLSNCTFTEETYRCIATTESMWLRVVNATASYQLVGTCDSIFYKKYADITKYNCTLQGVDPFEYLYSQIGSSVPLTLTMKNGVPSPRDGKLDGECVWEYELLGLWSIVAIVVLVSCIVGAIIFIAVIWFIAQKHRSSKRKRLDNALIRSEETRV